MKKMAEVFADPTMIEDTKNEGIEFTTYEALQESLLIRELMAQFC